MDDLGVAPILGNLEIYRKLQVHSSNSLIHMDTRSIKITHFFPSMFWPCTRFSEWFRADSPCLSVNSCSISYHRGCSDQLGSLFHMWIWVQEYEKLIDKCKSFGYDESMLGLWMVSGSSSLFSRLGSFWGAVKNTESEWSKCRNGLFYLKAPAIPPASGDVKASWCKRSLCKSWLAQKLVGVKVSLFKNYVVSKKGLCKS